MRPNTAGQSFFVQAFDDSGFVAGDAANITATLAIDGGPAMPLSDLNPVDMGFGQYRFDLTKAETDGYELAFLPRSASPSVQVLGSPANVLYTSEDAEAPGIPGISDRIEFARNQPGLTIYAQQRPKPAAGDWETAALAMLADPNDPGSYVLGNAFYDRSYECYVQAGAKPEPTDLAFWEFLGPQGAVADLTTLGTGPLKMSVVVTDSTTGDPVPQSYVDVINTAYLGLTDAFGRVDFNLAADSYELRVTPPAGYAAPLDTPVDLAGDQTVPIEVAPAPVVYVPRGWIG